jgi:hypothetical protein
VPGEVHRYATVYFVRKIRPPQLSFHEFVAEAVVGHEQQFIGGNLLPDDIHALILTMAEHQQRHFRRVLDLCHLARVQ